MILHLQRKFTSPTETFIVNQIKATTKYDKAVFTTLNLNNLEVQVPIFSADDRSFFASKRLSYLASNFFRKIIESKLPSLIHTHYLTDAAYFHPFTKNYHIPKVCSCYGYDVSSFPKKYGLIAKIYFKRIFKEYDLFLAMSSDMKDDLLSLGCDESKIKIHYHGINTKAFDLNRDYKLNSNFFNLLTIASLEPRKGHLYVLKAILKIKKEDSSVNLKYIIVGNGPLKKDLEKFVNDNGLENIVVFKPAIKHGVEFSNLLYNSDVFIHPSVKTKSGDKEGIPGTIVEAMSSGLPVISTYHAGIPSVIKNNETGLLVKEYDSSELADKMLLLYKDTLLREKIGVKAKLYAKENLDLFKKAKDLEDIYNLAITKRSSPY